MKDAKVALAIAEANQALQVRTHFTQDMVLKELALLAFSSVDHFDVDDDGRVTPTKDAPAGAMRAVSSIKRKVFTDKDGNVTRETELKLWDKPGPLKTAGKHVGLFNERELARDELENAVDKRIAQLMEDAMEARKEGAIDVVPLVPNTPVVGR